MTQKAILAGVAYDKQEYNMETSMQELAALAEACHLEVVGTLTQNLRHVHVATYFGSGKVDELKMLADAEKADVVIFNDELSPSQLTNLAEIVDCQVRDRTGLILQIFQSRANTKEAQLQVEIAHLRYELPRLIGSNTEMYSQQGGSGFRGSGEKQLELDRRNIKHQISMLEKELKEVVKQRQTQRNQRRKKQEKVVALVGYTNSGKSTLMNQLLRFSNKEEKQVLAKDMLFATLETATRSIELPNHKSFLLTDTVGFVNQLPHHLVKAFRSTLEEVKEADLLLHIVDASSSTQDVQLTVTNDVLEDIGVKDIPMLYVYNKMDLCTSFVPQKEPSIAISAIDPSCVSEVLQAVKEQIYGSYVTCHMHIPYAATSLYAYLKSEANILTCKEEEEGYVLTVNCSEMDAAKYAQYCK